MISPNPLPPPRRSSLAFLHAILIGAAAFAPTGKAQVPSVTAPAPAPLPAVEMPKKTLIEGGAGLQQLHPNAKGATLSFGDGETTIDVPKGTSGVVEIKPSGTFFDADGFTRMIFALKNLGGSEVKYVIRLENPNAEEWNKSATFSGRISPGASKNGTVLFPRRNDVKARYPQLEVFYGKRPNTMKGAPGGLIFDQDHSVDPAKIQLIRITVFPNDQDVKLSLGEVYASYPPVSPVFAQNPDKFFPFVDGYGQYLHETWPGKVTSDADLKAAAAAEEKDLAEHDGPSDRSKYGGWTKGPKLEATGFFRTEKVDGKWWFVDPEGYLFWSDGVTCVGSGGADTKVAGREKFFSGLPEKGTPLAKFYGGPDGGIFTYTQANLYRKFGPDWEKTNVDLTNRRLRSWGMNTFGNWSNPLYYSQHKLPYVVAVEAPRETVTWRKFPDVYAPGFREGIRAAFEKRKNTFNDPWCIGYFVDNELKFADGPGFVGELAKDPKTEPGKIEWVNDLKATFSDIGEFNRLVGGKFANWDAVLANTDPIKAAGIADEANAFTKRFYETYFRTCREEQKRVAPNQLYLGSRFLWNVGQFAVAIASDFCDVVSFNIYEYNVANRKMYGTTDKPFLVGEFHFGALDRGMFSTGNRWAGDQQDRGGMYEDYMTSALQNPSCVGAHWFQYNSQALTGRDMDGENFQIGFLDVTGNPYPEMRESLRRVGYKMYETRMNAPLNP